MKNDYRRSLFAALHAAATYDMETFGTGGIGVALALRFYGTDRYVAVSTLAQCVELSAAQLRRRLDRLVDEGKVVRMVSGKTYQYALSEDCAEEYYQHLVRLRPDKPPLHNATGVSYTEDGP